MRSGLLIVLVLAVAWLAGAACQPLKGVPASDPTETRAAPTAAPPAAAAPASAGAAPVMAPAPADRVESSHVVVFYFHRTIRCETCLKFEALTERALRGEFAGELANGRLVWRVMDFEEPGHESDVAKYDIFESSVIVSRLVGDDEREWKKLDAIWDLVGDDQVFIQYIQDEVGASLGGATHGE